MSNINTIRLSGTTYQIEDSNASKTVELTQAQYDALVDKDPNTFYVITDAEAGDLTNYYTKTEVDNAITAATSTKQDQLVSGTNIKTINNESILGSGNIDIQGGGGGKAVTGGTNISVTTGETADTINCTLNAKNGTGESSFIGNGIGGGIMNSATGNCATAFGLSNNANARASFVVGAGNSSNGEYSFVGGNSSKAIGNNSFAFGYAAKAKGQYSIAIGSYYTLAENNTEVALGKANVSNTGSTDADKTLFSVGNGTADNARHNAFEIRQNGDIYLTKDGQDVKLQDQLGGGGGGGTVESAITSGSTNAVESKAIWSATTYNKEVTLEFDNSSMHYSTNFPSGCTTVKVTVPNGIGYIYVYFYSGSTNYQVGNVQINKYESTPSVSMNFTDASYTIENNDVIITYPASKSVNKVGVNNGLQGAIVKAVVEGAFVNENTYMMSEVDGKIKALDDKKLDATAYTPTVVDSSLNAASTNPVQNQALYDELVIEGAETETTLTFSADTFYNLYKSTNYPNGCTKVKVVYPTNSTGNIDFFNGNNRLGYASIYNYGTPSVSLSFNGASYSIVDGVVVITYPTVTNVDNIRYNIYGTAPDSVKAVYTQTTHLIDQVTANTASIATKQDILSAGTGIDITDNVISVTGGSGGGVPESTFSAYTATTDSRIAEDEEVTAAGLNAVNDKFDGLKLKKLTQSEYDNLSTKDSNTLYVIVN